MYAGCQKTSDIGNKFWRSHSGRVGVNPNPWTTESVLWSVVTVGVNPSFRPRQPAVRVVMNSSQLCVLVQGKGIKRGAPVLPLGSVTILPKNLKPPPPLAHPPSPSLSYVIVSRLRLRSAGIYGLMTFSAWRLRSCGF